MARRPSTANVCSSIKDRDALMPATIRKSVKMGPCVTDSIVPLGSSVLYLAQCLHDDVSVKARHRGQSPGVVGITIMITIDWLLFQ